MEQVRFKSGMEERGSDKERGSDRQYLTKKCMLQSLMGNISRCDCHIMLTLLSESCSEFLCFPMLFVLE